MVKSVILCEARGENFKDNFEEAHFEMMVDVSSKVGLEQRLCQMI